MDLAKILVVMGKDNSRDLFLGSLDIRKTC